MLKFLAHDIVNDIALMEVPYTRRYWVRCGVGGKQFVSLTEARAEFADCLRHALETNVEGE